MIRRWVAGVFASLMLVSASVYSESFAEVLPEPHRVVDEFVGSVMVVVKDNAPLIDTEPDAYFSAVGSELEGIVAFDKIARLVMGRYAKQATAEQRQTFAETFKDNLIHSYAKALAVYADEVIEVQPPLKDVAGLKRVSVKLLVRLNGGSHELVFTMDQKNAEAQWRLLNVSLNGINLGKQLRSQFDVAMKKESDLDKVIASWNAGPST